MRGAVNRGSDGQNQLEYIGLVVLVAVVIAVLVASPVMSALPVGLRSAVCKILGGNDCPEPNLQARPHDYYRPEKCLVSEAKTQYGGSVSVIATVGADVALVQQVMSDGTVRITAVQAGHVGIEGGIGADVNWGPAQAAAEANVGLKVKGALGKTWRFEDQAAADEWVDSIRTNNRVDAIKKTGPLGFVAGGAYDLVDDSDPPDPDVTRYKVGLEGYGQAAAGGGMGRELGGGRRNGGSEQGGTGDNAGGSNGANGNTDSGSGSSTTSAEESDNIQTKPIVEVEVNAKVGGEAVVEWDHEKKKVSTIFRYKGNIAGGGNVLGHESVAGVPIKGSAGIQGSMKVVRTENGKLVGIEFVESTTVNNKSTVTTTKLTLDSERERRIARRFLGRSVGAVGTGSLTSVPWIETAPTSRPDEQAPALERLLYQEATISKAKYNTKKNPWQAGIEGKYGVKFGLEGHKTQSTKDLKSAQYLGAIRNGERVYVDYTDCVK